MSKGVVHVPTGRYWDVYQCRWAEFETAKAAGERADGQSLPGPRTATEEDTEPVDTAPPSAAEPVTSPIRA